MADHELCVGDIEDNSMIENVNVLQTKLNVVRAKKKSFTFSLRLKSYTYEEETKG